MLNLLLPLQSIAVMKWLSYFLLSALGLRCFLIAFLCSLLLAGFVLRIFILYSRRSRVCSAICYVIGMIEVRLYFFHFLFHFLVHLFDDKILFFILPLKSISLMLLVKFIDASISFYILTYPLRLSIIDFFHFTKVPHVDLISHFSIHNLSRVDRVYH